MTPVSQELHRQEQEQPSFFMTQSSDTGMRHQYSSMLADATNLLSHQDVGSALQIKDGSIVVNGVSWAVTWAKELQTARTVKIATVGSKWVVLDDGTSFENPKVLSSSPLSVRGDATLTDAPTTPELPTPLRRQPREFQQMHFGGIRPSANGTSESIEHLLAHPMYSDPHGSPVRPSTAPGMSPTQALNDDNRSTSAPTLKQCAPGLSDVERESIPDRPETAPEYCLPSTEELLLPGAIDTDRPSSVPALPVTQARRSKVRAAEHTSGGGEIPTLRAKTRKQRGAPKPAEYPWVSASRHNRTVAVARESALSPMRVPRSPETSRRTPEAWSVSSLPSQAAPHTPARETATSTPEPPSDAADSAGGLWATPKAQDRDAAPSHQKSRLLKLQTDIVAESPKLRKQTDEMSADEWDQTA
jgi:hypothetical protein